jgi:hypothetical protein
MLRLYSFYDFAERPAAGGGSFQHLGMWTLTLRETATAYYRNSS